jgi:hypothetical protein
MRTNAPQKETLSDTTSGKGDVDKEKQQQAAEKRKRDDIAKNKETLAKIMKTQQKEKEKEKKLKFTNNSRKDLNTLFNLGTSTNKRIFNTEEDKKADKRQKQDEDYKLKFLVSQTIKVYRQEDKKWYTASIIEVKPNGLVVKYEDGNEELIEWNKILRDKNNLIRIVSEEHKNKPEKKIFVNTEDAMKKGGGFSPSNCINGHCTNCSVLIQEQPFQSFKKGKGRGKNQQYTHVFFCSIDCMEKEKF